MKSIFIMVFVFFSIVVTLKDVKGGEAVLAPNLKLRVYNVGSTTTSESKRTVKVCPKLNCLTAKTPGFSYDKLKNEYYYSMPVSTGICYSITVSSSSLTCPNTCQSSTPTANCRGNSTNCCEGAKGFESKLGGHVVIYHWTN